MNFYEDAHQFIRDIFDAAAAYASEFLPNPWPDLPVPFLLDVVLSPRFLTAIPRGITFYELEPLPQPHFRECRISFPADSVQFQRLCGIAHAVRLFSIDHCCGRSSHHSGIGSHIGTEALGLLASAVRACTARFFDRPAWVRTHDDSALALHRLLLATVVELCPVDVSSVALGGPINLAHIQPGRDLLGHVPEHPFIEVIDERVTTYRATQLERRQTSAQLERFRVRTTTGDPFEAHIDLLVLRELLNDLLVRPDADELEVRAFIYRSARALPISHDLLVGLIDHTAFAYSLLRPFQGGLPHF